MIRLDPDPKHNHVINRAEITDTYEINVYSSTGSVLDTDEDLNGASRRALALAFIMAITITSGVKAPNIIDTPLGMMDPIIKNIVVKVLAENCNQVVLFLTRSEIEDIENILNQKAGVCYTLTCLSHTDRLKHKTESKNGHETVRCDCGIDEVCKVCELLPKSEWAEA